MTDFNRNPPASNADQIRAIDTMTTGLEKMMSGLATLRQLLASDRFESEGFDPSDPRNKFEIGGLEKLTSQGVEICYRLFDRGLSRYAVAQAMRISFGAATHRYAAWQKAGGINREKQPLD